MSSNPASIEVVRGRTSGAIAEELLAFWDERDALSGERARERLGEVVCVARVGSKLLGVCSVFPAEVPLVGGRRFWIYRSLLDATVDDQSPAMIRETFQALDSEFDGAPGSPIGLCVLISDPEERRRRPEAEWSDPRMIYAGYLNDGRQVRIAYFRHGRRQAVARELESDYRLDVFADQDAVSAQDVIDLWTREGGLGADEARRRVSEMLLVATDSRRELAGISTAYLHRNDQLRALLWHYRTLVPEAHRQSNIAATLAVSARDRLERRFVTGEDRRGIGIIYEVESQLLQRHVPDPVWPQTEVIFIGEKANGAHVRVYYFDGASAPEPDA